MLDLSPVLLAQLGWVAQRDAEAIERVCRRGVCVPASREALREASRLRLMAGDLFDRARVGGLSRDAIDRIFSGEP